MSQKINPVFTHYDAAHCESGSIRSMLKNYGLDISEPMVFGIASSIVFFYFPPVKVWGHPLISYRMPPRSMLKKIQERLGITFVTKTYQDEQLAMDELDALLMEGRPVGLQTSVAYLTYIIPEFRVYFNGHMLLIYGKEGNEYLVSDTVVDRPMRIHAEDLRKARFARGQNPPNGFMFYPASIPASIDYRTAIRKAVKQTVNMMLQPLFPIVGIKGIRTMARKFEKLHRSPDKKNVRSFLGNVLMFQEEMGTGGGGFRYLYAAFLQEAAAHFGIPGLEEAKKQMAETADLMRNIANTCAKIVKDGKADFDLMPLAALVRQWAESEKKAYLILKKIKWK
ncbi:MAG: BtrH N-terminal domain-containing protein [Spirochaetes bacterium]|nr:BtrH N-terminal domain-containing protein [Spirochaetota bacterium]